VAVRAGSASQREPLPPAAVCGTLAALLDAGAAPDRGAALHEAAAGGCADAAALLLARGASPALREPVENRTPAQLAGYQGHGRVMEVLLEAGAPPDGALLATVQEGLGRFRGDAAKTAGCVTAAEALLRTGVPLEERTTGFQAGRTALMCAAQWGSMHVVKALLSAGADKDAADEGGDNAEAWARACGNEEIASFLQTYA